MINLKLGHQTLIGMNKAGIIGLFLIGLGCNNSRVTWSTEAYSPSGFWRATADSHHNGGPGTALNYTNVYLQQSGGRQAPTLILFFTHQYSTMYLKLEWITDNHLEVTYGDSGKPGDRVDLTFQAVKFLKVEITAREVLSEKRKAAIQ